MTDATIPPRPPRTIAELHALLAKVERQGGQHERIAAIKAEIARG